MPDPIVKAYLDGEEIEGVESFSVEKLQEEITEVSPHGENSKQPAIYNVHLNTEGE